MGFEKLKARWERERKSRAAAAHTRLEALDEVGPPLFRRYGVRKAVLFGSTARGSGGSSPDIDLLVMPLPAERYWEFRRELEEALGCRLDLYTQADDPTFVDKVLRRGKVVFDAEG